MMLANWHHARGNAESSGVVDALNGDAVPTGTAPQLFELWLAEIAAAISDNFTLHR